MEATITEGLKLPVDVLIPFSAIKDWAGRIMQIEVQQELGARARGDRVIPTNQMPPNGRE